MSYKDSKHYAECTEQERRWFDSFYLNRDILAATQDAYEVSSVDSARSYARTVMSRERIKALISEFCVHSKGLPSAEDLKHKYIEISEDKNADARTKLAALAAYERLCGFTVKGKPTAPPIDDDPFAGLD